MPGLHGKLDFLAPGLGFQIDRNEELAVFIAAARIRIAVIIIVPDDADLRAAQARHAAAILTGIQLEQCVSVLIQHMDMVPVGQIQIACAIDRERVESRAIAAVLRRIVSLCVQCGNIQRHQRAAVGIQMQQQRRAHICGGIVPFIHRLRVKILRQVIFCCINIDLQPQRPIICAKHTGKIGTAIHALIVRLRHAGHGKVRQLRARARLRVNCKKGILGLVV